MLEFWRGVAKYIRARRGLRLAITAAAFLSAGVFAFFPPQPANPREVQLTIISFSLGFLVITIYLSQQVLHKPRKYRFLPEQLSPSHVAGILSCFTVGGLVMLFVGLVLPFLGP